jgi:hypothetical protein
LNADHKSPTLPLTSSIHFNINRKLDGREEDIHGAYIIRMCTLAVLSVNCRRCDRTITLRLDEGDWIHGTIIKRYIFPNYICPSYTYQLMCLNQSPGEHNSGVSDPYRLVSAGDLYCDRTLTFAQIVAISTSCRINGRVSVDENPVTSKGITRTKYWLR